MVARFFTHWRDSFIGIPKEIWFLSVVTLINRCGAMVITFLAIYLTGQLGLDLRWAGYSALFFGVGSIFGAMIGGKLTDKLGYYPVQLWSLILNGIILILMVNCRDWVSVSAAIFFMSFSSEMFRPANSVAMARHSTPETRTRSISLYRMAANAGWTIAPAFGGLLIANFGWNALFWVDGLTCLIAALFLRIWIKEKQNTDLETPALTPVESVTKTPAISPHKDKIFMLFMVLTLFNAIVFMQILWTVPVFWRDEFGWSEDKIGFVTAINGLMVFLIEMPLIFAIEHRYKRLLLICVGLALYSGAYAAFLLPFSPLALGLLFIACISFGEMFVMPFSSNFVFARSVGSKQGQYMAFYTVAYSVANIIAPFIGTQVVAEFGYAVLWTGVTILAILSGVATFMMYKITGNH